MLQEFLKIENELSEWIDFDSFWLEDCHFGIGFSTFIGILFDYNQIRNSDTLNSFIPEFKYVKNPYSVDLNIKLNYNSNMLLEALGYKTKNPVEDLINLRKILLEFNENNKLTRLHFNEKYVRLKDITQLSRLTRIRI